MQPAAEIDAAQGGRGAPWRLDCSGSGEVVGDGREVLAPQDLLSA
jgi:hypothetical protein